MSSEDSFLDQGNEPPGVASSASSPFVPTRRWSVRDPDWLPPTLLRLSADSVDLPQDASADTVQPCREKGEVFGMEGLCVLETGDVFAHSVPLPFQGRLSRRPVGSLEIFAKS